MKTIATFLLGLLLGAVLTPVAHASTSYSGQLERIARAAEKIADALEKASR